MAGVDRHTRAGYDAARTLLQSAAIERVPGKLADAIIEAHGIDPTLREPLRTQIRDVTIDDTDHRLERIRAWVDANRQA